MFDTTIFVAQKLAETEALRRDAELRRRALEEIARPRKPSFFARLAARVTRREPALARPYYTPIVWSEDNPVWT
jgi:hypothetical protein